MSKKRVANRDISEYINRLEVVEGSNIFTENSGSQPDDPSTDDNLYIVYSYGWHFPMYIYCRQSDLWYGNTDKYSVTTSKHQSQAQPQTVNHWLTTNAMKDLVRHGSTLNFLISKAKSSYQGEFIPVDTVRQGGMA